MPDSMLATELSESRPNLSSLLSVSSRFRVSLQAAARALSERELWNTAVLSVRMDRADRGEAYRVDWGVLPEGSWIPRNRHLYSDSVYLARCLGGRRSMESGPCTIKVGTLTIEAQRAEFAAVSRNRRALIVVDLSESGNSIGPGADHAVAVPPLLAKLHPDPEPRPRPTVAR